MTRVSVRRYVDCPFSAAIELAEKAAVERNDLYVTPFPPLGERVELTAQTANDDSDIARKHDALLIVWRPQRPQLFPEFRGALTVRPDRRGVSLQLTGSYEPPYGIAGKVFDFVAGRVIARSTMVRFLNEFATEIEAGWTRERATYKPA